MQQLLRRFPRRATASTDDSHHNQQQQLQQLSSTAAPRSFSEETLANSLTNDLTHFIASTGSAGPQHQQRQASRPFLVRSSTVTSVSSDSTAVDLVMGHSLAEYNNVRALPVISMLFQKGLYVFPSETSLNLFKTSYRVKASNCEEIVKSRQQGYGLPLLQCVTPMLSVFKRSSPILIIYKFNTPKISPPSQTQQDSELENQLSFNNQKFEFCKVYAKFFRSGAVLYTLKFQPNGCSDDLDNFEVKMIVSPKSPFVDTIYKKTRLRWVGTTLPSSLHGSGFFKLVIMNDLSPGLLDQDLRSSSTSSASYNSRSSNDQSPHGNYQQPSPDIIHSIASDLLAPLSSHPPVARFSETPSKVTSSVKQKIPQKLMFKCNGEVKLIEVKHADPSTFNRGGATIVQGNGQGPDEQDSILNVPESSLVMTCMSLVLRDQECRKNSGTSRGFDTHHGLGSTTFA